MNMTEIVIQFVLPWFWFSPQVCIFFFFINELAWGNIKNLLGVFKHFQ